MPSVHDDSAGSPAFSSPGYATPGTAGRDAILADLIARQEAAVDHLLASVDWDAHDALVAQLAADSARAADLLVQAQDNAFTGGAGPVVQTGAEDTSV